MRIALIGSRWFGAQMFRLLAEKGHDLSVISLEEEDQLTKAARAASAPVLVLGRARRVLAADIPDEVDAIAAVEWTMKCGDPIAGGSVYHLSDGMDEGPIAAQEWCFVYPDDDAGSLWRRALAPMGLRLLVKVVDDIETRGYADAFEQDPKAVTYAPALAAAEV